DTATTVVDTAAEYIPFDHPTREGEFFASGGLDQHSGFALTLQQKSGSEFDLTPTSPAQGVRLNTDYFDEKTPLEVNKGKERERERDDSEDESGTEEKGNKVEST